MDLKELGSRLKDERERQGLTMEQIMEITKVSRVNINAIESGNRKEFPHEVYAKGFIKTYAKALGLDAEEIGEEFSRIIGTSVSESANETEEVAQPDYGPGPKKSSAGTIMLVLILIGIVGGLVYYLHVNSYFSTQKDAQPEVVVEETVKEDSAPPAPEVETPVVEEKSETVASAPVETEMPVTETAPVKPKVEEAGEGPVAAESPVVAEHIGNIVAVTAKPGETCWLEAIVDGESKEYVLQEGETLSLPYEESLKLKLGNGGGVEISSNGKPFSFDASKGKVKKIKFPAGQ
ncbi:MAG TPA: DUF4115 domain-containing protein [Desulfovibrio sp.]|nr:DUF4115 domain-containing protein [Desulfovibrio sp.]